MPRVPVGDLHLLHDRGIRAPVFQKIPVGIKSALDLGFGAGEFGLLVKFKNRKYGKVHLTGVDIYKPYCEFARESGIYDRVVEGDAVKYVEDMEWTPNFTLCTEVLEHIPREGGIKLIELLDKKSERVLFATPLGFMPVPAGIDGNAESEHVSEYRSEDFTSRGYKVRVIDTLGLPWYVQPIYALAQWVARRGTYKHIIAWKGY